MNSRKILCDEFECEHCRIGEVRGEENICERKGGCYRDGDKCMCFVPRNRISEIERHFKVVKDPLTGTLYRQLCVGLRFRYGDMEFFPSDYLSFTRAFFSTGNNAPRVDVYEKRTGINCGALYDLPGSFDEICDKLAELPDAAAYPLKPSDISLWAVDVHLRDGSPGAELPSEQSEK